MTKGTGRSGNLCVASSDILLTCEYILSDPTKVARGHRNDATCEVLDHKYFWREMVSLCLLFFTAVVPSCRLLMGKNDGIR